MSEQKSFAVQLIETAQKTIWEAEARILHHFGISGHDRYAGEFPYPDKDTKAPKLSEHVALDDEDVRDAVVEAFEKAARDNGWKNLSVSRENDTKDNLWPYKMEIKVI